MSPSPEHIEYAQTLLERADEDLYACRVPIETAGAGRYDEPLPLDRSAALTLAERTCAWARDRLPRV